MIGIKPRNSGSFVSIDISTYNVKGAGLAVDGNSGGPALAVVWNLVHLYPLVIGGQIDVDMREWELYGKPVVGESAKDPKQTLILNGLDMIELLGRSFSGVFVPGV